MGIDINNEVMKAGEIMSRFRMPREEQIEVVRILMAAGVEHCLQEQERVRANAEELIAKAQAGAKYSSPPTEYEKRLVN